MIESIIIGVCIAWIIKEMFNYFDDRKEGKS